MFLYLSVGWIVGMVVVWRDNPPVDSYWACSTYFCMRAVCDMEASAGMWGYICIYVCMYVCEYI